MFLEHRDHEQLVTRDCTVYDDIKFVQVPMLKGVPPTSASSSGVPRILRRTSELTTASGHPIFASFTERESLLSLLDPAKLG